MTVIMPKKLTAENGAKALLIGEFEEIIELECPQCDPDEPSDTCEICEGSGWYQQPATIKWHTIKKIYDKAVEGLGMDIKPGVIQPVTPIDTNQYNRTLITMFITFLQVNFVWPFHDEIGGPGKRLNPAEILALKNKFYDQLYPPTQKEKP